MCNHCCGYVYHLQANECEQWEIECKQTCGTRKRHQFILFLFEMKIGKSANTLNGPHFGRYYTEGDFLNWNLLHCIVLLLLLRLLLIL